MTSINEKLAHFIWHMYFFSILETFNNETDMRKYNNSFIRFYPALLVNMWAISWIKKNCFENYLFTHNIQCEEMYNLLLYRLINVRNVF